DSPIGARFDSPGRVSPGCDGSINEKSPNGARFQFGDLLRVNSRRTSFKLSASVWDLRVSPRWGFAARLFVNPGHRFARPGLSNLAPFGAESRNRIGIRFNDPNARVFSTAVAGCHSAAIAFLATGRVV